MPPERAAELASDPLYHFKHYDTGLGIPIFEPELRDVVRGDLTGEVPRRMYPMDPAALLKLKEIERQVQAEIDRERNPQDELSTAPPEPAAE